MRAAANGGRRSGEEGSALLAVLVAVFMLTLFLTVAAPLVARKLQHDREEHTLERAHEYVRAIRLYYRKFGHYPGSIEQLEKTNNIRFLRQRYVDPLTGKDDWRIIHVGENKTQVTGFFGEPLAGLPGAGGGSAPGGSSFGGAAGSTGSTNGSSSGSAGTGGGFTSIGAALFGAGGGATGATGSTTATGAVGAPGTDSSAVGATGASGATGGIGSGIGSGGGGMIMGFGLNHPGNAMVVVNQQTTYDTWEFLYDPRSEPKPNLGGGVGTAGPGGNNTTNPITGAFGASGASGSTGGAAGATGSTGSTNSFGFHF